MKSVYIVPCVVACGVLFLLLTSFAEEPDLFDQANQHLDNDEWQQAIEDYNQYLDTDPQPELVDDALIFLGYAYSNNNQLSLALDCFQEIVDQHPDCDKVEDARFSLAQTYYQMPGQGDQAIDAYVNFLDLYPNSEHRRKGLINLGHALVATGEVSQGIQSYRDYLQEFPDEPDADSVLISLGNAYCQQNQFSEAISTFQEIIDRHPESSYLENARLGIAQACYQLPGQENQAIGAYEDFLNRYPNSDHRNQVLSHLGHARVRTGDLSQGIQAYETYLQEFPSAAEADSVLISLIYAYSTQLDYPQAVERCHALLQRFPDSSYYDDALREIAYANLSRGELDDAMSSFQTFLLSYPDEVEHKDNVMLEYSYTLREKAARLRIDESTSELAHQYENLARGICSDYLSRTAGASLIEDGTTAQSDARLRALFLLEEFDQVVQEAQQALAEYSGDTDWPWVRLKYWLAMGKLRQSPADESEAIEALDALLSAELPDNTQQQDFWIAKAGAWRSWLALKQGDRSLAEQWYRTIRDQAGQCAARQEALDILEGYLGEVE